MLGRKPAALNTGASSVTICSHCCGVGAGSPKNMSLLNCRPMVRTKGSLQPPGGCPSLRFVNLVCGEYFAIADLIVVSRLASCCWTVSKPESVDRLVV